MAIPENESSPQIRADPFREKQDRAIEFAAFLLLEGLEPMQVLPLENTNFPCFLACFAPRWPDSAKCTGWGFAFFVAGWASSYSGCRDQSPPNANEHLPSRHAASQREQLNNPAVGFADWRADQNQMGEFVICEDPLSGNFLGWHSDIVGRRAIQHSSPDAPSAKKGLGGPQHLVGGAWRAALLGPRTRCP